MYTIIAVYVDDHLIVGNEQDVLRSKVPWQQGSR
jgi:hypothetical protein